MPLSLSNIKANQAHKKKNRVGRGNSSGNGTYSGRGQKGQKSRSGVSGLKRLGMKKQLLAIPKKRGFRSLQPKNQVVKVVDINKNYKDGEVVNLESLLQKKLIETKDKPVKVLGKEALLVKNLKFEGLKMSAAVKEKISQ
jgi:large subunit ribosomal protein L15